MTRDRFQQEMRAIEEAVIQMAAFVESAIARATQAFTRRDATLAHEVIAGDNAVNELQRSIRNRCISVMARQAPVTRDLRELITAQLVISELERMGDHAVGIANQMLRARDDATAPLAAELNEIAKVVREQVRDGIQAFIDVNLQLSRAICTNDDDVDSRYRQIFTETLEQMAREPAIIPGATSLLFAAHDLERIGDRVTNICEDVIYMVTGEIEELN